MLAEIHEGGGKRAAIYSCSHLKLPAFRNSSSYGKRVRRGNGTFPFFTNEDENRGMGKNFQCDDGYDPPS